MTTTTTTTDLPYERNFAVIQDETLATGSGTYQIVLTDGTILKDRHGRVRNFATANSARKTITRLRRPTGDRHR